MKIITKEEVEKLSSSLRGKDPVLMEARKLKVGQFLLVETKDWNKKTPLTVYLGQYKIREGLEFKTQKINGTGWLISRIK